MKDCKKCGGGGVEYEAYYTVLEVIPKPCTRLTDRLAKLEKVYESARLLWIGEGDRTPLQRNLWLACGALEESK